MSALLFSRLSHPTVRKKSLALFALLGLIVAPVRAADRVIPPGTVLKSASANPGALEVAGWKPLPMEVRREVDAFFTDLELALNYNKLELVMQLYTPDAVEVKADGSRLVFAGIRQHRQEEMDSFTKTPVKPAVVQRNYLVYQPGTTKDEFKVKYPVRAVGPWSGMHPSIENIVYTFRRGGNGLQLSSLVVHANEGINKPGPASYQAATVAPDPDGPAPTEIRLTNGVKLRQVKVLQWAPDSLLIQYVGGTVPIRMVNIHADDRAYFTANMDRMMQAQKAAAVSAAQISAMNSRMEENRARGEARMQAEQSQAQEQRQSAIEDALAHHKLAVGMTTSQVRRSWGEPSRVGGVDTEMGHSLLWSYEGRGIDDNGAPANAGLAFVGDTLTVMINVNARDKASQ